MPYVVHSASIQAAASQAEAPPAPPAIPQLPAQPGAATSAGGSGSGGGQARTEILIPPPYRDSDIPREVIPLVGMTLGLLVAMVVGFPIARAIGRVIERRGTAGVIKASDVAPQLRQLQESVDAMAIELERVGEAQRFTAKLMSDRAGVLPAGERPPL